MKIKRILILVFVITGIVISCNNNGIKNDEFRIQGQFKNGDGVKIYLYEILPSKSILIDSTRTDANGSFSLKDKINEPGIYDVKISKSNFIRLLIDKGENIDITGDSKELTKSYSVTGSEGSDMLKQLNDHYYSIISKVDSMTKVFVNSKNSPDFQNIKTRLDTDYRKLIMDYKKYLENFISIHNKSIASLVAIYQKIGHQLLLDLNNRQDVSYFIKLDSSLTLTYPDNKHVIEFHKSITEYKRDEAERTMSMKNLETGAEIPDINLPNIKDRQERLSSLRGKVVLLDFWASWCKPCRQENPNLVKIYKKYKSRGFEIYSVSLDRAKDDWIKAIKDDNISWIQVSDLKYWSSPIVKQFNVEELPYSILINREGKIVAKGLLGRELEKEVGKQCSIK